MIYDNGVVFDDDRLNDIYRRKRNYYFSFILQEVSIVFIYIALMKLITD